MYVYKRFSNVVKTGKMFALIVNWVAIMVAAAVGVECNMQCDMQCKVLLTAS